MDQSRGIQKRPLPAKETRSTRLAREKRERDAAGKSVPVDPWSRNKTASRPLRIPPPPPEIRSERRPLRPSQVPTTAPRPFQTKPATTTSNRLSSVFTSHRNPRLGQSSEDEEVFVSNDDAKRSLLLAPMPAIPASRATTSAGRRLSIFQGRSILGRHSMADTPSKALPSQLNRMSIGTKHALASLGSAPFVKPEPSIPEPSNPEPPSSPTIVVTRPSQPPSGGRDEAKIRAKAVAKGTTPPSPMLDIPSPTVKRRPRNRQERIQAYADKLKDRRRSDQEAMMEALKSLLNPNDSRASSSTSSNNSSNSQVENTMVEKKSFREAVVAEKSVEKKVAFREWVDESESAGTSSSSMTPKKDHSAERPNLSRTAGITPATLHRSTRLSVVRELSSSPDTPTSDLSKLSEMEETLVFALGEACTQAPQAFFTANDETLQAEFARNRPTTRGTPNQTLEDQPSLASRTYSLRGRSSPAKMAKTGFCDAELTGVVETESTMLDCSQPTLLLQRKANIRDNYPPLAFSPIEAPTKTEKKKSSEKDSGRSIVSDALTPARVGGARRSTRLLEKTNTRTPTKEWEHESSGSGVKRRTPVPGKTPI